jgi:hypothetical protein
VTLLRLRAAKVTAAPTIIVISANIVISATFTPVNGSAATGVRVAVSPRTSTDGRLLGVLVSWTPSTAEQVPAVAAHWVPAVTHCGRSGRVVQFSARVWTQLGAVGVAVQVSLLVVTQLGAGVGALQLLPPLTQPGAVGGAVQFVGVLGGVVQPVCAGLVRPMPWFRSHS